MPSVQETLDALAHAPDDINALRAVCTALLEDKRDDELLPYTSRALAIEPRDLHFVNWHAHALTLLGRHFDTVATWRNYAALPWQPAYYKMSLGQSLVMSGDVERGIPMLHDAWRTAAAGGDWFARKAEHLYGEALLRTARPAGFEPWLARNDSDSGNYQPTDIAPWSGEQDLRGKRVLITHQMGFGDQFLFFANVSQWRAAGAQMMITCDAQLHPLLQASLPDCHVVSAARPLHQREALPEALASQVREFAPDLHATLLHLPLLAAQQSPLPSPFFPAYLRAPDAEREAAAAWARDLRTGQPGKSLIGIFWDCNQRHAHEVGAVMRCSAIRRSLPLTEVGHLVTHPSVAAKRHFVSLHHPAVQQFAGMPSGNISVYGPGIRTFAETAACIEQLDAVVAVDSGVANLSAMLGKLTVVPLNMASEWRWGVEGDASPWMANLKPLRQTLMGDWRSVIDEAIGFLS
ncbi:hypothetical protein [Paraburkholderia caribensis]|uniref:hypothetical protein n=1 Tax=Paraburkholderia caribensis TaxID=75105 RepID=UPI001CB160B5|nr:hypothetical protein [Paraburkholderia caribensis]CAG9241307.1 conserved hypothetical protein [Paraburkholderia caribensis]